MFSIDDNNADIDILKWRTFDCHLVGTTRPICQKNIDLDHASLEVVKKSTCQNLTSLLVDKDLYLREYHIPPFIGSHAVYECAAGYSFPSEVLL